MSRTDVRKRPARPAPYYPALRASADLAAATKRLTLAVSRRDCETSAEAAREARGALEAVGERLALTADDDVTDWVNEFGAAELDELGVKWCGCLHWAEFYAREADGRECVPAYGCPRCRWVFEEDFGLGPVRLSLLACPVCLGVDETAIPFAVTQPCPSHVLAIAGERAAAVEAAEAIVRERLTP